MNKQEAINEIKGTTVKTSFSDRLFVSQSKAVRLIEQIEEPYKPVIPYYIADYLEKVKSENDYNVVGAVNEAPEGEVSDWLILENVNTFAKAWINGYEVEKEARYMVRVKGVDGYGRYLNKNTGNQYWFFASENETESYRTKHTRKELEQANFGWVFDCEGMEVKEVTDEQT